MKKFPWDCKGCPMLHTYDLSVDDLTHICLWSKTQIDDCDRYKSAECPMEKHDKEIRLKFAEWLEDNNYLWEREYMCGETWENPVAVSTIIKEYEKENENENS